MTRPAHIPVCALLSLSLVLAAAVRAQDANEIELADRLVRTHWFEGMPYEAARELGPAGVSRLAALLLDPGAVELHANAVTALGMSERPRAFGALRRFALNAPRGEVDLHTYRARMALPFALGHLARADRRALQLLLELAARRGDPGWSYRGSGGERLGALLERSAVTALGISGRPEALRELDRLRVDPAWREPRRARHLEQARRLGERVAREGAAQVFGRGVRP